MSIRDWIRLNLWVDWLKKEMINQAQKCKIVKVFIQASFKLVIIPMYEFLYHEFQLIHVNYFLIWCNCRYDLKKIQMDTSPLQLTHQNPSDIIHPTQRRDPRAGKSKWLQLICFGGLKRNFINTFTEFNPNTKIYVLASGISQSTPISSILVTAYFQNNIIKFRFFIGQKL